MTKTFICLISMIFLFSSCFLEVHPSQNPKLFDYELSTEVIRTNEPLELIIRYCPRTLEKDELFSIKRLDDLEMEIVDGELYECKNENALFVKFVEPSDKNIEESNSPYADRKYCKLRLIFKKAGVYELRILRTTESILKSNFDDGHSSKKIKVE